MAPDDADAPPAPAVWVRSIRCPVLYTHEVPSQAAMRRVVSGLEGAGYQPTSLASVDSAMAGESDPPPGCLVLTFDDGLLSQFQNGVPVLLSLGLPAVFFVLPGFADGVHRYMGPQEYRALAGDGFEVELHTCNHPNLPQLARRDLDAFYAELQDCKHLLEETIDQPVDYLAYPFGAFDATVLNAVASFGYQGAFSTRASAVLNAAQPFTLPRIRYDPSEAPAAIVARIHAAGG